MLPNPFDTSQVRVGEPDVILIGSRTVWLREIDVASPDYTARYTFRCGSQSFTVDGVHGADGWTFTIPTTGTTIQDHATIQDTAARLVNEAELPSDETITSVWTTTHGKSLWSSALAAPRVKFGHMAVAPERTVAYFGVHHWHGSTNLVIRNAPAGLPSVQAVPAYADGDYPALAAPLFLSTPKHYP